MPNDKSYTRSTAASATPVLSRSPKVLRGLIVCKGALAPEGDPTPEEAWKNWLHYRESGLGERDEEDRKIVAYVEEYYAAYENSNVQAVDLGGAYAAPTYELVRDYYETQDAVEVVDRLGEIRRAPAHIRTNYKAVVQQELELARNHEVVLMCREAAAIAEHGRVDGKRVVRGAQAAAEYLSERLRAIEGGRDDVMLVSGARLSRPLSPPSYLVPHYSMRRGRPTALVSYAGRGKTYLACELALAVAAGLPTAWGGLEVATRGPVVHLDYDSMGVEALADRYQRLARGLGVDLSSLGSRRNNPLSRELDDIYRPGDPLGVGVCRAYLTDPGAEARMVRLCRGTTLLIVDSLRAACPGVDENSSEVRRYLDLLSRVSAETGCCVLVLHHERKDGQQPSMPLTRMRGSSSIADGLDASVHVEVCEQGMRLVQGKHTHGRPAESHLVSLADVGEWRPDWRSTAGIRVDRVEPEPEESRVDAEVERLVAIVRANPDVDRKQLYKLYGGRTERVAEVVKLARERGHLQPGRGYRVADGPTMDDIIGDD